MGSCAEARRAGFRRTLAELSPCHAPRGLLWWRRRWWRRRWWRRRRWWCAAAVVVGGGRGTARPACAPFQALLSRPALHARSKLPRLHAALTPRLPSPPPPRWLPPPYSSSSPGISRPLLLAPAAAAAAAAARPRPYRQWRRLRASGRRIGRGPPALSRPAAVAAIIESRWRRWSCIPEPSRGPRICVGRGRPLPEQARMQKCVSSRAHLSLDGGRPELRAGYKSRCVSELPSRSLCHLWIWLGFISARGAPH